MLVLSRKCRESVVVGGAQGFARLLKVTVLEINGTRVRLGFEVDSDVPVNRFEVWERIQAETLLGNPQSIPPTGNGGIALWAGDGGAQQ
jgi:carbon storage regulator CsrA